MATSVLETGATHSAPNSRAVKERLGSITIIFLPLFDSLFIQSRSKPRLVLKLACKVLTGLTAAAHFCHEYAPLDLKSVRHKSAANNEGPVDSQKFTEFQIAPLVLILVV